MGGIAFWPRNSPTDAAFTTYADTLVEISLANDGAPVLLSPSIAPVLGSLADIPSVMDHWEDVCSVVGIFVSIFCWLEADRPPNLHFLKVLPFEVRF